jgi:hypothetical protein
MSDSPLKPRRGAPVGNTNAVKHGLYSQQFRRSDIEALKQSQTLNLTDEINMIRVNIRHVVELSSAETSLPASLDCLRVLSVACICLTRLINTQRVVQPGNDAMEALNTALEGMINDMKSNPLPVYDPHLPHAP